jgi:hypothetical protein
MDSKISSLEHFPFALKRRYQTTDSKISSSFSDTLSRFEFLRRGEASYKLAVFFPP